MLALIAILLLAALLFGVGFALHFLWIIAAIVLVVWLIGFVARAPKPPGIDGDRVGRPLVAGALPPIHVEIGQVPVALFDVESVPDEELVRDGEADVAHR